MWSICLRKNTADLQREGNKKIMLPEKTLGGNAPGLRRTWKRTAPYILLACFLAAAFALGAPASAGAAGEDCSIGGVLYETLQEALLFVADGETITLLQDITPYGHGIFINGKDITFDLNGYTLEVINNSGTGIHVVNAAVDITGSGQLNVTGTTRGVHAECTGGGSASVTVTNAHATGANGIGAFADTGAEITVQGNATASGDHSLGAYAQGGAVITVEGDSQGRDRGTVCYGTDSQVFVEGDSIADGPDGIGAEAGDGGEITIDGQVYFTTGYLKVGDAPFAFDGFTSIDSGYRVYTHGGSTIRVKIPPVCAIGATEYIRLEDALRAVLDGETIKLLADIPYSNGIFVDDKNITFDLNGHTLEVINSSGTGLRVENHVVDITGGGQFNITGTDYGVYVTGTGASAKLTDATAIADGGCGASASNSSTIEILGDVEAVETGVLATSGSNISVGGEVAAVIGARAEGIDSRVSVGGDISATVGATALGGGTVIVDGDVQAIHFGVRAGSDGHIIIGGNVTATDATGTGAATFEATRNDRGIIIDGAITANTYITVGGEVRDGSPASRTLPSTMPGYHTYSLGQNFVWVKIDITPPGSPANLRVTDRTSSSISLAWDASSDDTLVRHYVVEMKQGSGPWTVIGTPGGTSLSKAGLASSTPYLFRVKAVDAEGNESIWSEEITGTTRSSGGDSGSSRHDEPDEVVTVEAEEVPLAPALVIVLTPDSNTALVNGQKTLLDSAPFIQPGTGRAMVPIRFVSEQLGAKVGWSKEKRQVTIIDGETELVLTIGSSTVLVNGQFAEIDCPAEIKGGRTFVPLRFVSENLGAEVNYDSATKQITIAR